MTTDTDIRTHRFDLGTHPMAESIGGVYSYRASVHAELLKLPRSALVARACDYADGYTRGMKPSHWRGLSKDQIAIFVAFYEAGAPVTGGELLSYEREAAERAALDAAAHAEDARTEDLAELDREEGEHLHQEGYSRDYCASSEQEAGWDAAAERARAAESAKLPTLTLRGRDFPVSRVTCRAGTVSLFVGWGWSTWKTAHELRTLAAEAASHGDREVSDAVAVLLDNQAGTTNRLAAYETIAAAYEAAEAMA